MTSYDGSLTAGATVADTLAPQAAYGVISSNGARATATAVSSLALILNVGATISDAPTYFWAAGALIAERIKITDLARATMVHTVTMSEAARLKAVVAPAAFAAVAEHATVSTFLNGVVVSHIVESARASGVAITTVTYQKLIHEAARATALLQALGHIGVSEGALMTDAIARQYIASAEIMQHMSAQTFTSENMRLSMLVREQAVVTDAEILHMIWDGRIAEDAVIGVAYVSPDHETTTWVMNTRTNALTEYRQWSFNSFAQIGNKFLASAADGLYELDGERDNTSNIVTMMAGGMAQLNGGKFAGLKGVYLGMNTSGEFFLKLTTGTKVERLYRFHAQPDLQSTKVKIGKGVRARYIQWELISDGSDFNLDTVEFIPMASDRRA